ncbi:3'-5' exonuclease [Aeromonas jandaei]|uniref:3'-5' exonuclease n=1 Tax=Aeromonas jandaei TaxID=650 RepID=UPI002B055176|nr:3'-5' exonuclease [Aeromonas jandaei]
MTNDNQVEFSPIVIVLDTETLGRGERAVIGTIGAVARNVMSRKDLGQFYTRINLELNQPGREIHEDVTEWWDGMASSNPAAWREMFDHDLPRGDLPTALASLAEFIAMVKAHCKPGSYVQVMGNGPEFDNAIMAHAYESHGMALPWQFRANQSLRTPVWLGRLLLGIDPKYEGVFAGTKHHALHDAKHEAEVLQAIIDNFRNFTP